MTGASFDINMSNALACLTDELEMRQLGQKRFSDCSTLSDEHQGFSFLKACNQGFKLLDTIMIDGDLVSGNFAEAIQMLHGVLIIVGNNNPHLCLSFSY